MRTETTHALAEINRRFYQRRAEDFSASRGRPWPGWDRVMDRVAADAGPEGSAPRRVLDAGCGNGRFGERLVAHLDASTVAYLGLDSSDELLTDARRALEAEPWAALELEPWDLVATAGALPRPPGNQHLAVLFGVLHHVPGAALRRQLLASLALSLAPGGWLAVSVWRFGEDPRFHRRTLAWQRAQEITGIALDLEDLEPGDRLLAWGPLDGGPPPAARYCHALGRREEADLLAGFEELGLELMETFEDDGRGRQLNGYWLLRRRR